MQASQEATSHVRVSLPLDEVFEVHVGAGGAAFSFLQGWRACGVLPNT